MDDDDAPSIFGPPEGFARLGVISDTHDYFDPRLPELFAGVEHILHAGDVGHPTVLEKLSAIAPVTAVLGNTDFMLELPETDVYELAGRRIVLHHIVDPHSPSDGLHRWIAKHAPDIVIYGHTHKALQEVIDGRLFVNPGYAGRPKGGAARTVAFITLGEGTEPAVEIVGL